MLIGWTTDYSDSVQASHINKGYVGKYVKSSNITFDKQGKIFCYGDGTQCLVRLADK